MSQGISAARCIPARRPGADPACPRAGFAPDSRAAAGAAIGQGTGLGEALTGADATGIGRPGGERARVRTGFAPRHGAPLGAAIGQGAGLGKALTGADSTCARYPGAGRALLFRWRWWLARPIVNTPAASLRRGVAKIGAGFYRIGGDRAVTLLGIAVCAAGCGRAALPVCPDFSELAPVFVGTRLDMFKKVIERR